MTGDGHTSGIDVVITTAQAVLDYTARWGGAGALLSRTELDAAERFRNPADGRAYAGAHVLFRLMAARSLGATVEQAGGLAVHRECLSCGGPHGKPGIAGTSLSLSRSGQTVMVASGPPGPPLGADVEAVPARLHAGFDEYSLSAGERRALEGRNDVEPRIRCWVAKEAALKASGHGLSVDPAALHIGPPSPPGIATDGWGAAVQAPTLPELHGMSLAWLPAPAGFVAALATAGRPVIRELDVGTACAGQSA